MAVQAPLDVIEGEVVLPGELDDLGLRVGTAESHTEESTDKAIPFPELPDDEVVLPGGFMHATEGLMCRARVRELNGADEEALSRVSTVANPVRFIDTIVHRCLVDIGGHQLTESEVDGLLVGDRDMLVLGVRRATYGDMLRLEDLECPSCQHKFAVDYSLTKDVPIRKLADPMLRTRTVKLRRGDAQVVLVDGAAQKSVYGDDGDTRNVAEMNTALLRRCVQKVNGLPVMRTEQVREQLSSPDRTKLLRYLSDNQPGPRYEEVTQACPSCDVKSPLVIGLADLFRPV